MSKEREREREGARENREDLSSFTVPDPFSTACVLDLCLPCKPAAKLDVPASICRYVLQALARAAAVRLVSSLGSHA